MRADASGKTVLRRGDFVRHVYHLGLSRKTGVATVELGGSGFRESGGVRENGRSELLVLRHGQLYTRDSDPLGRKTRRHLEKLAHAGISLHFESGLAAYPPSVGKPFSLVRWAREHIESQLDSTSAQQLVRQLAGIRLSCISERLPPAELLDETDRRMLQTLARPRRLDQIWPMSRAPRFRLLSFVHFLRSIGAIREDGVAATRTAPPRRPARGTAAPQNSVVAAAPISQAMRVLGLNGEVDASELRRTYHRLARELHPDLQGEQSPEQRRQREQRLASINEAYRQLMQNKMPYQSAS